MPHALNWLSCINLSCNSDQKNSLINSKKKKKKNMANSHISKIFLFNNIYCKFILNTLQECAFSELKNIFFWGAIYSNFKN